MQMLRPGLCWLHVLDVARPLRWCVFRVHTLGVRKRKRTVACTMVSAYLWVCTVKYKFVYAYTSVVGPGLYGRDRPVFVNITLPKNIPLLIPGRRSLVHHAKGIFSLDIPASICSPCTVHILGAGFAQRVRTFLFFFFFLLLPNDRFFIALSCLVESWLLEKNSLLFSFFFSFPLFPPISVPNCRQLSGSRKDGYISELYKNISFLSSD